MAREARSVAPVTTIGRAARTAASTSLPAPSRIPRSTTGTAPPNELGSLAEESASKPRRRKPRAVISARRSSSSTTSTRTVGCSASSASLRCANASSMSSSSLSTGGVVPSASAISSSAFNRASVERRRCRAAGRSGLRDEPVSDPTYRLDPARLAQRTPHLMHRLLHAVLESRVVRAPRALEQLVARHDLAGLLGQDLQRGERPSLEAQLAAVQGGGHAREVDAQASSHQRPA